LEARQVDVLCDRASNWSRLEKDLARKKLKKIIKRGDLYRLAPLIKYRLCCARFYLGDFSDYTGWEWRDENGWSAELFYKRVETPQWGGQYVNRLVVMGEQGLGDQIFFASILPECRVRVKEVIYECDSRLHSIMERSLGVECRDLRSGGVATDCDAFIPAGDLMRMFRRDKAHFPGKAYLVPAPERLAEMEPYKGRVGYAWRGRQGSIDPTLFRGGVSVQYQEEIDAPHIDVFNDIEGLFALVSVLDRVVTVPQTVHHIAGSLGKKVQIVVPTTLGVENQIPWDYPLGKLPWYKDATVLCISEFMTEKAESGSGL
jgi:hypothetical protein